MQKIALVLASIIALVAFTGCSILGGGSSGTDATGAANQFASLARIASYAGAATHLQSHPDDRAKFEMARTAVDSLLAQDVIDPLTLRESLALLPIKELRGDNSAILITSALLLLEDYSGQRNGIQTPEQVKAVATAIRDGLGLALATTAPAPAQ